MVTNIIKILYCTPFIPNTFIFILNLGRRKSCYRLPKFYISDLRYVLMSEVAFDGSTG